MDDLCLYHKDTVHELPTATLGNFHPLLPSRIIPLPTLFLKIDPVSNIASLPLFDLSNHFPLPE